jgi:hypothetical protein
VRGEEDAAAALLAEAGELEAAAKEDEGVTKRTREENLALMMGACCGGLARVWGWGVGLWLSHSHSPHGAFPMSAPTCVCMYIHGRQHRGREGARGFEGEAAGPHPIGAWA